MVLGDGSPHRWFGPDYPPGCLLVVMDDATGKVLAARFFPFEGSAGYLWLLRQVVDRYGIPVSIYQDRHGFLKRNDDRWTLEEELAGRQEPTQVGQALKARMMMGFRVRCIPNLARRGIIPPPIFSSGFHFYLTLSTSSLSYGPAYPESHSLALRSRSMKLGLRVWAARSALSLASNSSVFPLRTARSRRSTSSFTAWS